MGKSVNGEQSTVNGGGWSGPVHCLPVTVHRLLTPHSMKKTILSLLLVISHSLVQAQDKNQMTFDQALTWFQKQVQSSQDARKWVEYVEPCRLCFSIDKDAQAFDCVLLKNVDVSRIEVSEGGYDGRMIYLYGKPGLKHTSRIDRVKGKPDVEKVSPAVDFMFEFKKELNSPTFDSELVEAIRVIAGGCGKQ